MKKAWMILGLVAVCALISTVSAVHFPSCDNGNRIVVTYVNSSADYNDVFGIVDPVTDADINLGTIHTDLGLIHKASPGQQYYPIDTYPPDSSLEVFIKTPDGHTYRIWKPAGDGVPSPYHTKALEQPDGSWTVGFEDTWHGGDLDYNDVFLNVACEAVKTPTQPDPLPTPEFPTMALPAAMIVGLLGAVLFMKRTKESTNFS